MVVTIYLKTIQDSYFKYDIQTKVHTTMDPKKIKVQIFWESQKESGLYFSLILHFYVFLSPLQNSKLQFLFPSQSYKVQVVQEGHKIWNNLPHDMTWPFQNVRTLI